jgi:hypothetical protein
MAAVCCDGAVPLLFAEGSCAERLPAIADDDLPRRSVMWWFDATDMRAAKGRTRRSSR